MNEEKYTPPKSESNIDDEDDVWYFDSDASSEMVRVLASREKARFCSKVKNEEQKLLKNVYYIPALRSNVISLRQATISGYDISIRGDFLTMRDSWGSLLIKVPRSANRLYKAQLKVGKEGTNKVGWELDEEVNPHSSSVTVHETSPKSKEDNSRSDNTPNPLVQLKTIRLLIALAAGKGWKIHILDVKTAFLNGDRKKLDRKDCVEIKQERYAMKILKEAGMEDCNPALCPMEPGLKLSKAKDKPEVEATQHQKMILCYLKGTTLFGIKYKQSNDMRLVGYSNHNVDIDDGWITTGHVFYLAEFMAAIAAACQEICLRELLVEVT
ncbi:uncharacterized mitochondrial protein-like protein [Tanacetum coccineum]